MNITLLLSLIIISLILSAFFSGMEIAFITANKFRIELDKKQDLLSSGIIKIFTKNPGQYIATMLVGNNIALVIYGLYFAKLIEPYILLYTQNSIWLLLIQTVISTGLILITAEFLPKTIFRQSSNFFLNIFAFPVLIFYIFFYPIAKFTVIFSNTIIKLLFKTNVNNNEHQTFGRIDLNNFLSIGENENINAENVEHEVKIFKNALDFSKVKVRECYVPRNEIIVIDIEEKIDKVKEILIKTKVSKILVYKDTIDNIIGFIHTLDIYKKAKTIKAALNKIIIVPETMPANKLLNKFIKSHQSVALVVDEFGGTSGMVTMEDIIEEILGEIEDEHDTIELFEQQISDKEFILSGRIEIDYLNSKYNLQIPNSSNYETIAGLILNIHEQIPKKGEIIEQGNLKFEIIKVEGPKIQKIKLTIKDLK